jgi:hypothetical protein
MRDVAMGGSALLLVSILGDAESDIPSYSTEFSSSEIRLFFLGRSISAMAVANGKFQQSELKFRYIQQNKVVGRTLGTSEKVRI